MLVGPQIGPAHHLCMRIRNGTTKTVNAAWREEEHQERLKNDLVSLKRAHFAPLGGASALYQLQLCDFCQSGQGQC